VLKIKSKPDDGFTLVELLISLAIMVVLLTGMTLTLDASIKNYDSNKDMFDAMNKARQSLLRITRDVRNATAIALIGAGGGQDPDNSQCSMVTGGDVISYRYENTAGAVLYEKTLEANTLYLVDHAGTGEVYKLCDNVTAMTFDRAVVPSDPTSIRNVRISITVQAGDASQTVCTAAVVKKNL